MLHHYKWFLVPVIGNLCEWYEFGIFSSLASIVGQKFFNTQDPLSATLFGFMIYGVAYISRPFGTFLFGYLGDRHGRKKALTYSLLLMCLATSIIPFLPTYDAIGYTASALLVGTRMIQGISLGGEFSSVITYTCEHAPTGKKGLMSSIQGTMVFLGILLGFLTMMALDNVYTQEQMFSFGWKIPFFGAVGLGALGFIVRYNASETPEFLVIKKSSQTVNNPFVYFFRNHMREFIICSTVVFVASFLAQSFIVGSKTLLQITSGFPAKQAGGLSAMLIAIIIPYFALIGHISERKNLFQMRIIATIAISFTFFGAWLMSKGSPGSIAGFVGLLIIAIVAATWLGLYCMYIYRHIPANCRDTGAGFIIGLPAMICGAFGAVTLLSLFKKYAFNGIYLFLSIGATCAICGLLYEWHYITKKSIKKA